MSGVLPQNDLKGNLEATFFFVEADSFAQHALWYMHVGHPIQEELRIPYVQVSRGFLHRTGPETTCCFNFAYIYGKLVCFYYPTSTIIDWNDIALFFKPYTEGKHNSCNAQNFHKCVLACK